MRKLNQQVRIIGGNWRGRKLYFPYIKDLRPSSDRVRETLFNWLSPHIVNSRCLDLFAGSGALGLEAASRGAEQVFLVDKSPEVVAALKNSISLLNAENTVTAVCEDAEHFISRHQQQPFDIIFLDPPFARKEQRQFTYHLIKNKLTQQNTRIYIETDAGNHAPEMPQCWSILREKTTRQVRYQLVIQSEDPIDK
ncbi:MAG: 16S rRNA (guanine(966)-N(2))-methyltransferase RsmD [Gammaproteobacteria bacterium]|nr:16S rRNA (guanine(966)-N(2))-methyltransferase RsmD [Gammaproteobacteria bacterium]